MDRSDYLKGSFGIRAKLAHPNSRSSLKEYTKRTHVREPNKKVDRRKTEHRNMK